MDNGEPFLTVKDTTVDISHNIDNRLKRGLGLYLVNRLSDSFSYQRYNDWNVSRFSVSTIEPGKKKTERRSTTMSEFKIEVIPCERRGSVVLKPIGSIDSASVEQLESQISSFLQVDKNTLIIDFSQVDFISSSGIGILLGTVTALREKGGDLIFMSVPKHIQNVFDIINMGDYFVTINSLEELESKPGQRG